jgi:putative phosphoesterase
MMRIAVISDTHDHLPAGLVGAWWEADEIWHLGDVCEPSVLVEIEHLGRPLIVMRGNCDLWPTWPLEQRVERAGITCWLTHIPPARVPSGVDLVLHGHLHVPRDETDAVGVRWLSPGCISRATRGAPASWAWLELAEGREPRWTLVRV